MGVVASIHAMMPTVTYDINKKKFQYCVLNCCNSLCQQLLVKSKHTTFRNTDQLSLCCPKQQGAEHDKHVIYIEILDKECLLTPRGLSAFSVDVIIIINTVPFGTCKLGCKTT